jgi:hypothetical protein
MLFHNNRDGTFTDVTDKAGVANERWGFGVAVGDYDNDGWPDIYIATIPLKPHHVAANSADAAEMALEAGVDIELPAADAYHSLVGQVGAPSGL